MAIAFITHFSCDSANIIDRRKIQKSNITLINHIAQFFLEVEHEASLSCYLLAQIQKGPQ